MHHWLNTMRHVCFLDLDLLRLVVFRMSSVNVMTLYPIEDAFGLPLLFRLERAQWFNYTFGDSTDPITFVTYR